MIKIGILGGAFNPPTIGHIRLAEFVLSNSEVDEVWLMPCFKHMYNKDIVDSIDRVNMCDLACKNVKGVHTFDYEFINKFVGCTHDLIVMMNDDPHLKDFDFNFIIGQDNANTIHKWKKSDLIKKLAKFIVVSRKGFDQDQLDAWYKNSPHVHLNAEDEIPECSSTEIRDFFKNQGRCIKLKNLDKMVHKYILRRELYDPVEAIKKAKEIRDLNDELIFDKRKGA